MCSALNQALPLVTSYRAHGIGVHYHTIALLHPGNDVVCLFIISLFLFLPSFLPSWQTDTHSNSIPASVSSLSNRLYFSFFRPCPLSTKWGYLLVKEAIFFFASRKFSSRVNFGNIVSFVSFPRVRGRPSHFPRPIISDWLSCPAQLRQPISNQIWSFYFKSGIFYL